MATKPILYSYFRSSCSWRVRIALALKGVDYEYKPVHLVKDGGEQHGADYKKQNAMEQVPTFVVNDQPLVQSAAIIEYVEENYPEPALLPKDLIERAKIRGIVEVINSGIQPIQNLSVLQYLDEETKKDWARHWIHKGFVALEQMLKQTAGKYCFGDQLSLADLYLPPQVYNANRFKVDMSEFPVISRLNEELSSIEAFKRAHPSQQPDCPDESK